MGNTIRLDTLSDIISMLNIIMKKKIIIGRLSRVIVVQRVRVCVCQLPLYGWRNTKDANRKLWDQCPRCLADSTTLWEQCN